MDLTVRYRKTVHAAKLIAAAAPSFELSPHSTDDLRAQLHSECVSSFKTQAVQRAYGNSVNISMNDMRDYYNLYICSNIYIFIYVYGNINGNVRKQKRRDKLVKQKI